ncbi:MAG TPA: efflux RND transporter periplasmic adaptor subunit [Caldimonas sp.]|nr:efflux RND transporter periplasmic adaptor subunit [Caldimonas sp.]
MPEAPPPDHSPSLPPPRWPRRRWLGGVVAVLALVGLGSLAWYLTHRPAAPDGTGTSAAGPGGAGGRFAGGGGRGAPASTVGVAAAATRDMPVILDALGTVTPVVTVTVRPQVSGVITQVLFTEGQMVAKGQLLVQIDPRPFDIALQQATGARLRDEAQLENARLTLQRYQTLLQQDSIARQDVDTQAALVKQLEGTVTMDKANEATARLNVGYTRVVAPSAGRIGLRPVDAGNYISTGDANGVATITQVAPIDVEFAVPQDRVPEIQSRVAEGARLPVTAWDRTRTRKLGDGVFSTLDNLVDLTTGTVKAKARFANAGAALFPNQFVNVQILLRMIANAVVVPVTALRHGSNGDFVYVLQEDRTVTVRPVTRGEQTVDVVAITTGLQPGERVVTEGGDRLKEGARVQVAGERPAGAASGAMRGASGARGRHGDGASALRDGASGVRGEWAGRRASGAASRSGEGG